MLAGRTPDLAETEAPGCLLTRLPEEQLPEAITWSRHISRLLQENCETYHRPGQVGPFSLQTYEQARGWGEMIGSVIEEGRMPPWNATASYAGVFANERRLSPIDRKRLLAWIEAGMPRGNPAEDPQPRVWQEGWSIGEPAAVFTATLSSIFAERFRRSVHERWRPHQ